MGKNYKYIFPTKEDRKFNKFLDMTIKGTAYNFFKSKNTERLTNEEYNDDKYFVDNSIEKSLFKESKNIYLDIALKSLTKKERLVISFVFEESMRGKEIADILEINTNTVYIIKKRALKKIEKIVKESKKKDEK